MRWGFFQKSKTGYSIDILQTAKGGNKTKQNWESHILMMDLSHLLVIKGNNPFGAIILLSYHLVFPIVF